MVGSFTALGWLIISIGLILGSLSYSMSLILKGQLLVIYNENTRNFNHSNHANTLDKLKNVYNATKKTLKEESIVDESTNNDLKI